MSDVRMPEAMITWMQDRGWGEHHDQWHFERRWDFWHYVAQHADPATQAEVKAMIEYAESQHWSRADVQEGELGNGVEFLMMHRAMLQLLAETFPEHEDLLRGWSTPPTDPGDPDDPVAGGTPFDPAKVEAIQVIEAEFDGFDEDDAYGLFIETNIRPRPDDPTYRDPDGRLGIHNYLHNRWTDQASPVNLGDPRVNIFNARFWKLHGWIDRQWGRFRAAKGLSDDSPDYRAELERHREMMAGHPHHHGAVVTEAAPAAARPAGFGRFFEF